MLQVLTEAIAKMVLSRNIVLYRAQMLVVIVKHQHQALTAAQETHQTLMDFAATPRGQGRSCYGTPPTCPAGQQLCNSGCIQGQCRPNTKTCAAWAAEQCTSGTGPGNSCGSCSDFCAGPDQCHGMGGTNVGSRCSGGTCSTGSQPCLICSSGPGPGDPPPPTCTAGVGSGGIYPFVDLPATATVGQAAQVWGQYATVNGNYTILNAVNADPRDNWHENKMYSSNPAVVSVTENEVDPWHGIFGPLFNWSANSPGTATITYYVYGKPCPACDFKLACQAQRQITVAPNCFANCSAGACGQSDGCGGTCPTTNVGTPPAPTITSPLNGQSVTPTGTNVTIRWNNSGSALVGGYTYELYPEGSSCSGGLPGTNCATVGSGTTSLTFTVPANHFRWTFRVRANNNRCAPNTQSAFAVSTFSVIGEVKGNFFINNTGACSYSATPLSMGGATGNVRDRNSAVTPVNFGANGTSYSAFVPYWPSPGNNIVTITPGINLNNGLQLRCNACNANGSDLSTCVGSATSPGIRHFYLTDRQPVDAWYQVTNGSIYSALTTNTGIRSYIPSSCTTAVGCSPFLLPQNVAGAYAGSSAGIGVTGGASIDTNIAAGNSRAELTQRATTTTAAIGTKMVKREDYAYFSRLYDLVSTDPAAFNDFDGSPGRSTLTNAAKPTLTPRSGKKAYIAHGNLNIAQPWIVGANEKIVVFVTGDLYFNDPSNVRTLVSVAPTGFIAFIVQGKMDVGSGVGHPSPFTQTTPNITGVYIVNGSINTISNATGTDLKFLGAGNFVSWTGFNLQRTLGTLTNNATIPAESFISRPDLVKNVPLEMTSSNSDWQEIN